jgi:hypothetical protein
MWAVIFSEVLRMFHAYDVGRDLRITPTIATLDITTDWLPSKPATFVEGHRLPPPSIGRTAVDGCHTFAATEKPDVGSMPMCSKDWLEWRLPLLSHWYQPLLPFLEHPRSPLTDNPPSKIETTNYHFQSSRQYHGAPIHVSLAPSGCQPIWPLLRGKGVPSVNASGANNSGFGDIKFGTRSPTRDSAAAQDSITPPAKRKKTEHETPGQFACPFFKHDPTKYREVKPCGSTSWPDVHRVK